jgi:hypothetical protein
MKKLLGKNIDRALRAQGALDTYCELAGDSPCLRDPNDIHTERIVDLLTDIRHWIAGKGLNIGYCLRVSEEHFRWETEQKGTE